jgi:uncharacterized membrane protein YeaQ/YmgE (transglycosylase-associated protein family)
VDCYYEERMMTLLPSHSTRTSSYDTHEPHVQLCLISLVTYMNILLLALFGAMVGAVASSLMGTRSGIVADVVIGILGSVIGGWIMNYFGESAGGGLTIYSFLVALFGACVLIVIMRALIR